MLSFPTSTVFERRIPKQKFYQNLDVTAEVKRLFIEQIKLIGFRVFRVDESNMKNVYYHPEEVTQLMLGETVSNIKEDRTDLDLLYACLLDWGVEINLSHTSTQVAGCTVHNVDNGALAACFDKAVPRAVVEYIANLQPLRAVFRDSAFATDAEKINVTEIFKNLSPDTKVKVI